MLFYHPDISSPTCVLSPEESGHIVRVLRKGIGDQIEVTDGKGLIAKATLVETNSRKCRIEIIETKQSPLPPVKLHLAVSPTKNIDRITWMVEKAVEIGINEISFPICHHSERKVINIDKIVSKAISALKQSKGAYLPKINETVKFKDFLQAAHPENDKYIAHLSSDDTPDLMASAKKGSSYLVVVGPEGDFTDDEISLAIKKNFKMVKLGNKRLRTETAALHACSMINAIHY